MDPGYESAQKAVVNTVWNIATHHHALGNVLRLSRPIQASPVVDGLHIRASHQRLLPYRSNPEAQREIAPAGDQILCKIQNLRQGKSGHAGNFVNSNEA